MRESLPWQISLALSLLSLSLKCDAQAQYPLRARPVLIRYQLINGSETPSGEIVPPQGKDGQSTVEVDDQDKSSTVHCGHPASPEEHTKGGPRHSCPAHYVQADFLGM